MKQAAKYYLTIIKQFCVFISFYLTLKFTVAIGLPIIDQYTITEISQNYEMAENSWDRLIYLQNEYDGVDYRYTTNYFSHFVFDHAVNIMLVMMTLDVTQGTTVDILILLVH
ncbi:unnamed protein product [Paramecium sonneborni]|uniref:Uncharacterized protein n=1 Tax=Paramecium sonneborni TaxID=65129 RepID=A0A8S1RUV4_9CILI|nr:unnamed protein product [Paramecium sonneborni]